MKQIIKNTVLLTALTVILGLILGIVHDVTLEPIAAQEQKAKEEAYQEVFETADIFEDLDLEAEGLTEAFAEAIEEAGLTEEQIDLVATASDDAGTLLGYVLTVTTAEGYGGDIQFTLGIDLDGTMMGISFLSIEETAGLGMRADTDEFKSQFKGKQVDSISYSKTGASAENEIDALSGATITSNAVTNGVNAGLAAFRVLTEGGQS